MAILWCSDDNHDPKSRTAFELKLLDYEVLDKQKWLRYEIIFHLGEDKYKFSSIDRQTLTHTGMLAEIGKFAFAIEPYNELKIFIEGLEKFLIGEHSHYRFEVADPSFEIIIERTKFPGEYKVYVWVDAGNTKQLEYTWDGIGIRFLSTEVKIRELLKELNIS